MKNLERQPPIWESSVRPLYPKCVWIKTPVDSVGSRHFLLDYEIPKCRNSDTYGKRFHLNGRFIQKSQSYEQTEDDLMSLRLIGSDVARFLKSSDLIDSSRFNDHHNGIALAAKDDSEHLMNKQLSDVNENICVAQTPSVKDSTLDHRKDDKHPSLSDTNKSQLTERVLQWLDLAGRSITNNITDSNINNSNNHIKRRSLIATDLDKQTKSSSYFTSIKDDLIKLPIKRTESVHRLSLAFNENEACASPSTKNLKCDNSIDAKEKLLLNFSEFFPVTYRCARKFLSAHYLKNKPLNICKVGSGPMPNTNNHNNINERNDSTVNSTTEFRSNLRKMNRAQKKNENVEIQYRSMIQRQILENSCNMQLAKRQLHIFMPNLPGRMNVAMEKAVENNTDCDSIISSSTFSKFSK